MQAGFTSLQNKVWKTGWTVLPSRSASWSPFSMQRKGGTLVRAQHEGSEMQFPIGVCGTQPRPLLSPSEVEE